MRTVGFPMRLGIGILAATSAYAGLFATRGGDGSGAMSDFVLTHAPAVSGAEGVPTGDPPIAVRAGYMVTSGRVIAR